MALLTAPVPDPATDGRSVTSKVFAILGAFDEQHPRRPLTELAAAADLPLSTALRLVRELVTVGALVRGTGRRYEIGRLVWELGHLAPVSRELREVALPFMQDLAATTHDNVHLAILQDRQALYVERISGTRSVPVASHLGARLPLHATAVGKVLLAHADRETVDAVLATLARSTPYTITQPGRLHRQLADIRRRGWAQTAEEMTLGTVSIAVPVTDSAGAVVAALGLVCPTSRREPTRYVPALTVAARSITRISGGE